MADRLGIGTHEVWITDRGGRKVLGPVTHTSLVEWTRRRDDVSSARVVVLSPDAACCGLLAEVRTIRHEMVILRNGERVWEGIITYLSYESDRVEIVAQDLFWWLNHRALERSYDYKASPANTTTAAHKIVTDHFPAGADINLNVVRLASPDEPRTSSLQEAWTSTVGQVVDGYAQRSGIDYAVVGRTLALWDTHLRHTNLGLLDEHYFLEDLRVVEYGAELVTRLVRSSTSKVSVTSAPSEWTGYYGLVDKVESDQAEATDGAPDPDAPQVVESQIKRLDQTTPVPLLVVAPANTSVTPDIPVPISKWVPGAWAILQSNRTCRAWQSWMKVDGITVTEQEGVESVQVTFESPPRNGVDPA